MGKFIKTLSILAMSIVLLQSCDDEGCIEPVVAYTLGFVSSSEVDPAIDIKGVSVWGIGQASDSVMVSNQTDLDKLELLLNPNSETTQMRFEFYAGTDTITDTITFYYKNRDYFLNIDCGCSTFYNIDSIESTGSLINDIEIINPEVTNEKKFNFKLLY